MLPKVLITDAVHELLIDGLTRAGYQCDYLPDISMAQTMDMIPEYEGLIINSKILVKQPLLDKAVRLRFVGRLGSGLEIVDLAYARQKGVRILSSPNGNCDAVAEHALAMLLATAINLRQADSEVRQDVWNRELRRGWELGGKTVGIVGFGHTGSAFARRLSGFNVQILAYDKYKSNYASDMPHVCETSMERIWAEADIVSIHLPLTEETCYLIDDEWLTRLKKSVVFINTSRGQIIRTATLLNHLDNGNIRAACLDVFENEKPHTYTPEEAALFHDLWSRDNVLVTPHIAGWTVESKQRLAQILLDKILEE